MSTTEPSQARRDRLDVLRGLGAPELCRIYREQQQRLTAGRAEEKALIARWLDIHSAVGALSLTTNEIAAVIAERRGESRQAG